MVLTLVTQKEDKSLDEYLCFLKNAVNFGVNSIQIREKSYDSSALEEFYLAIKDRIKNIPIIINDNLNVAAKVNADGLHLGQGDGDIKEARKILGPNAILGLTVNNVQELQDANKLNNIDYIGIGAIFKSDNKKTENIWGIEGLKDAINLSIHPVIAIGGINRYNVASILNINPYGIAVIGELHTTNNLKQTVATLCGKLQ